MECKEFENDKKIIAHTDGRSSMGQLCRSDSGLLGESQDWNYVELVETLVANYGKMGCRMSLNVHILDANLDQFKESMRAYFEEQGDRFHQDVLDFERRYQGSYNERL